MSAAATKCLRFKEPEVDDYVVYKYTESESTEEEVEGTGTELEEIKEETEEELEADEVKIENKLISDTSIKNSIELLNSDRNNKNNNELKENIDKKNKNKDNIDNIKNDNSNENENNNNILNNNNENNNENNANTELSNENKLKNFPYESMDSFVVYKDGDSAIIEGIPQIEIKLNISRDNLLANQILNNINNSIEKNLNANGTGNNLIKNNSNLSLNSNGSNKKNNKANSRSSSKSSLLDSSNKINKNKNENIRTVLGKKSNSSLLNKSNNSIKSKQSSRSSLLNAPKPEGNTRNQKSIEDRSLERTQQSQKKMMERKLMREKLRSEMNEKRNKKISNEISININNLEDNNNEEDKNNGKIKLVSREKPLNKNSDNNSNSIINPYTPRNKSNDSEIIPKKDEDINEILKEVGETHFLVDDSEISLDYILKIIGQTEIDTIDNTLGSECLETATHMKNYEHGAIFRLPSEDNCILKIIPFDPERNDLDMERNFEDNQVSLKTVLQEVIATTVLAYLHTSGEVTASKEEVNQVTLEIEDEEISNEKKILAFARPEGTWICRGSTNQAFNYEFQNYQLSEFSQDQYFLVILFNNRGEIINSVNNKNRSLDQIKSVLWQICYSLALAEDSLEFEHRELYPECILVENVPREELKYKIDDKVIIKDNFGVKATILDYSRSRLEYYGKVYYSDLTNVVYDDPSKKKSLEDLKTVLDSTWYQTASIVNRASFADLIQSFAWIVQCDKAMTNWLYNNMLEFAVRVEYNIKSMREALNDPFWNITKEDWETQEMKKLNDDYDMNTEGDCIIL